MDEPYKAGDTAAPLLNAEGTSRWVLRLDQSDPTSIAVNPDSDIDPAWYTIKIGKKVVRPGALEVDTQAKMPSLDGSFNLTGIVQSVSGSELTIVTDEGAKVSIMLQTIAKVVHPSKEDASGNWSAAPADVSDISPGDQVIVLRQLDQTMQHKKMVTIDDSEQVVLTKANAAAARFTLGHFSEKDAALRTAKALIHAMVLCHKDAPPSLF